MKRIIIILLLSSVVYAADTKTTDLTELTAVNGADLLYIVDDVAGTATGKKITVTNLFDIIDTSAELYGFLTNETGSGGGTPLAVFNYNPTLTGATLAGILADNDDMVFECDADSDGSNKFSFTDGASSEVVSITEAGLLSVLVGIDGIGAIDLDYGSVDITDHTFTTDDCVVVIDGGITVSTGDTITLGTTVWNSSDNIDGEVIKDDTIDNDSIDWGDMTDLTTDGAVVWTNMTEGELTDQVIVSADIKDDTIDSADYAADSIDNEHINWADIDNLGDEGAVTLASTATVATTVTITDNENTAENNPIVFVAGGDLDGGDLGLESDGTTYYTPSTGTITATAFVGSGAGLTALDGENITNDTIDADSLDWEAFTDLGEGGAVTWGNIAEGEIADSVIVSADIKDDTIDSADYAAGSIDNEHLAANAVDSDQYVDDSIDNAHVNFADFTDLGDGGVVTWGNIAEGELANSTVISADIKDDTIDSADYAAGSIDDEHIADNTIQEPALNITNAGEAGIDNYLLSYNHAGTNFTWVASAAFDSTTIDDTTWSDNANATNTWTFDVSGTDHTMVFGDFLTTLSARLLLQDTTLETTATYNALEIDWTKTGGITDQADDMRGINVGMEMNHNGGTIGHLQGIRIQTTLTDGTVGDGEENIMAGVFEAKIAGGTTNNNLVSFYTMTNGDGGTVSGSAKGADIRVDLESEMATISENVYGIYMNVDADQDPTGSAYMIYLDEQTNIDYGIYQNGTAGNSFGGLSTFNAGAAFKYGATDDGFIQIYEDTDDGGNYTKISVQAQAGDITYVLPADDGDAGEQLQTDGNGNLTWEAAGGDLRFIAGGDDFNFADDNITTTGTIAGATITEGGNAVWNATETDIIDSGHYIADSIDNEHINWSDIDNLDDEGQLIVADSTYASDYVVLVDTAVGSSAPKTDGALTYDATSGTLAATQFSGGGGSLTGVDAATGDSASSFFDAGTIEHEYGGLEADVHAITGLLAISAETTTEIDALDELEGQLADVTLIYTEAIIPAAGTDPDVDAVGEFSIDTDGANEPNDVVLRSIDGGNTPLQIALAQQQKSFQATIIKPNDLEDATRDACPIWSNETGMSFVVTKIEAWSDTDDTALNVEEEDGDGQNNTTIDAVNITTDGTGMYYTTETTITGNTVEANHLILLDFDDTDDPGWVKISICGYFLSDVD